jgi:molybdopterin molybdotransferase
VRELSRDADWVGLEAALSWILEAGPLMDAEEVALDDTLGRVLADAATSPVDLPPWHNSAMDGYAVRGADVAGASPEAPVRLLLMESVQAGGFPTLPVRAGQAIKIMTGAPLPAGADSVVRVEHTSQQRERVIVTSDADAGRNVRKRGEDVTAGQTVISAGTLLRPGEIGLLASIGQASVRVRRKPVVAILSTGDELVDVDGFDEVRAASHRELEFACAGGCGASNRRRAVGAGHRARRQGGAA